MKQIIYERQFNQERAALVEDGEIEGFFIYQPKAINQGDIYVGKVSDIHNGLQGAFIDLGEEQKGFLHKSELLSNSQREENKKNNPISHFVKKGDKIIVQVKKEAAYNKGPLLTELPSLAYSYTIYMPKSPYVAVSKRIPEKEREQLRHQFQTICEEDEGVIIRTAAQYVNFQVVRDDYQKGKEQWKQIMNQAESFANVGKLYSEERTFLNWLIRDYAHEGIEEWVVNDRLSVNQISSYLKTYGLKSGIKYHSVAHLFEKQGVETAFHKALGRKVYLPSGGSLIIDYTEALTAIDVNTEHYTQGSSWKNTAIRINLEAVQEIARQLRIRRISGIIIIDLINMNDSSDYDVVMDAFQNAIQKDRSTIQAVNLTALGLIEFTRKVSPFSLFYYKKQQMM